MVEQECVGKVGAEAFAGRLITLGNDGAAGSGDGFTEFTDGRIGAADAEIASAGRLLNHRDIQVGQVINMDRGPVLVTRTDEDEGTVVVAWRVEELGVWERSLERVSYAPTMPEDEAEKQEADEARLESMSPEKREEILAARRELVARVSAACDNPVDFDKQMRAILAEFPRDRVGFGR